MSQENNKNGIDLSKHLDHSTEKSQTGQRFPGSHVSPTAPKITQWLIKYSGGLIKNEKQAFYVILGFIVLTMIISFYLIFGGARTSKSIEGTEYRSHEGYGGQELPDEFR